MIKSAFTAPFMANIDQNANESESGFDPSIQSEKLAFDPERLVKCVKCGRSSPPNRLECLYCGSALEIDLIETGNIKPGLKKPELWERGHNLISIPLSGQGQCDIATIAHLLSLEESELSTIIRASIPLPLCRAASESEAVAVQRLLARHGLETAIVNDDALLRSGPPVRLGGLDFSDTEISLISFNTREQFVVPMSEIALLVEGIIAVSKVDQMEKRTLRGATMSSDEVSTISDEPILDIYLSGEMSGYRVQTSGFDFSCLGERKGLLAAENLRILISNLTSVSASSKLVAEYRSLRHVLGTVWEVEMRRDTKGIQRTGFGKREQGSVISTSNLGQFTKFSRLQRHLL